MRDEERRLVRLLCSHLPFGTHELFPQTATYLTILRDPVDRFISHYFAFHKDSGVDLKEYAARPHTANRQVQGIAGVAENNPVSVEHLEIAKQNLSKHFAGVGLTERFAESLALFSKVLRWERSVYIDRNVASARPTQHDIDPAVLETIKKKNGLDTRLYEFSVQWFEKQLLDYGVTEHDIEMVQRQHFLSRGRLWIERAFRKLQLTR